MINWMQNEPIAPYTTLKIGGPATYLCKVHTQEELLDAIDFAKKHSLPPLILGKGSNCLIDDRGFDGVVIINKLDFIEIHEGGALKAGSGAPFPSLARKAAKQSLSGLEFALGIPSSVGGAVFMNAGAGGQETKDSLTQVSYIDEKGSIATIDKNDCAFCYRSSIFQSKPWIITEASFTLHLSNGVATRQKALFEHRLKTQPYEAKTAGCAFKNPPNDHAARLIESLGLKGSRIGGALISEKHANFIENEGFASAQNVLALASLVKEKVFSAYGIVLEDEIRYIPYNRSPH